MSTVDVITSILNLLAGIGIFLVACSMMSSNLETLSSSKLRSLFSKAAGSKLLGVGIGTVGTAAIQSSGATTVMVIGFVNAGIMTLEQAATIIYGANIGTTITSWILSLSSISSTNIFMQMLKPINFSPVVAFIGILLVMFAKKDKNQSIGNVLLGFSLLRVKIISLFLKTKLPLILMY